MKFSATTLHRLSVIFGILLLVISSVPQTALADNVAVESPPPVSSSAPNIIVTALAGSALLDDAEIYNQTAAPINLANWQLDFTVNSTGGTGCGTQVFKIAVPAGSGWLLPKSYFTFERSNGAAVQNKLLFDIGESDLTAGCSDSQLANVTILDANGENDQSITIPTDATNAVWQQHQRGNSPNSTRTVSGNFSEDYEAFSGSTFYSSTLYMPPNNSAGLQILEILPHARDCSPSDTTSPDCSDYVKLYNPTSQEVNLANYRLRIGYKGQSTSVSNTFTWGQTLDPSNDELMLEPGKYFTLMTRNDGTPLSVTDSGGYIWLEDAYGTQIYSPIIQYPSASSTTKIGQAWAFDGQAWRWTTAPHPFDANYFPPEEPTTAIASVTSLKPCAADQYRNSETNRCRKITVSASTLVPCNAGQIRSPDTNRCRSILASASGLQPCKPGQERNATTNRCRSIAAASTVNPCQAGWTRNPDTNRCRKTSDVKGASITKVQDVKSPIKADSAKWLLASAAILAALGYALYEWRQELIAKFLLAQAKLPIKRTRQKP